MADTNREERPFDRRRDTSPSEADLAPFVSWRDYVDSIHVEHRRALDIAQETINEAVNKATSSAEKRHEAGQALNDAQFIAIRNQLDTFNDLKANEKSQVERVESLRRESEAIRDAGDKAVTAALSSAKEAVVKAEIATEKRFEGVNEFRQQLADQVQQFMPREVAEAQFKEMRGRIEKNSNTITEIVSKQAGSAATIGLMLAIAAVVISIIVLFAGGKIG